MSLPSRIIPPLTEKDIFRFWNKVAITANDEKCWNWIGYSNSKDSRGIFTIKRKPHSSPRIVYYIANNVDPKEKLVLHSCDNPSCVNPKHLRLGTVSDNGKDMYARGRDKSVYKKGENHKLSKLKDSDVLEIRSKYAVGNVTQKQLGNEYNIDASQISYIVNRKHWNHI